MIANDIDQELAVIKPLLGLTNHLDLIPEVAQDMSIAIGLALSEVFRDDES